VARGLNEREIKRERAADYGEVNCLGRIDHRAELPPVLHRAAVNGLAAHKLLIFFLSRSLTASIMQSAEPSPSTTSRLRTCAADYCNSYVSDGDVATRSDKGEVPAPQNTSKSSVSNVGEIAAALLMRGRSSFGRR
jgi:hypothetical protein